LTEKPEVEVIGAQFSCASQVTLEKITRVSMGVDRLAVKRVKNLAVMRKF